MAKTYFQPGENIDFTTAADVLSGDVIVAGNLVGIAANSTVGAGVTNVMTIKGVWRVAKATGAVTQGAKAYWNASSKTVSTTSADVFMGYFAYAADSAAAIAYVLLARPGS